MRTPVIAGNWKMHKTAEESVSFINQLKIALADVSDVTVVLCPPFTALSKAMKALAGSSLHLGAQDMYVEDEGAYTGAISPLMIKEFCEYVIVGHSERRGFFGESNEFINTKVKVALQHGIVPMVCVGESLAQRKEGAGENIIKQQLTACLDQISITQVHSLILAYEPIWAISRDDPTVPAASPEIAQTMHLYIRGLVRELYDEATSQEIRILYGGSMKPDNVRGLMAQPDIDGGLVGGASLDVGKFAQVVRFRD
jgi:triosephosphate isomerase